ncbi:hypothetical protein, partial [Borreliella garinii]|uniref:hypothetical protein n=1 Tax=Borreliella garinii TaxID=29519 RepID=UPI001AEEF647
IIFPNNQQIDFIGYANGNKIFGKSVGGSSYLCSRTDEIIMAEEKETLSEKQLTQRYERLKNYQCFEVIVLKYQINQLKTEVEHLL